MLFTSLNSNDNPHNYKEEQNTSGDIKSQKVHNNLLDNFDKLAAIERKAAMNINPKAMIVKEILPAAFGTKAPTTSEPKIIFAPSSKKFAIILNCSGCCIF